ncbi:hypothetical protein SLA2020_268490 [Shorea laevis]
MNTMVERGSIAASLAAFVCHPTATIMCFRPTTSPRKETEKPKAPPSKSKKKLHPQPQPHEKYYSSSAPSDHPLPHSKSRSDKLIKPISELVAGDPSVGVVETIFQSGWPMEIGLTIRKVLKVNHSANVLNKFEEYRKKVKFNADLQN